MEEEKKPQSNTEKENGFVFPPCPPWLNFLLSMWFVVKSSDLISASLALEEIWEKP
jgi:hypothetical protein